MRRDRTEITWKILSFLCVLCASVVAATPDPLTEAVLGIQKRYAAVDSLSADFQQTYRGPGIEQTESGVLWMKKPGLMRWEYKVPEEKLFVADGRESFLYTPADHQVQESAFSSEEMHSTPLRFLLGEGDIMKTFSAAWEKEFKPRYAGTICLRLAPRNPDSNYAYVVIECDTKSYDLKRLIIGEPTGNTSEFLFTNLKTNLKLDRKIFQFRVPRGVEVVHLDEK